MDQLANDGQPESLAPTLIRPSTKKQLIELKKKQQRTHSFEGIIAKDPTSLEEEIKEIRRSGSSKALDNTPEFELSDIFYFCRKGMETIMDDKVTKRFSAEELESWNLLSRTNYNLHSISLRLMVLWGLGVLICYCFLLPLRIALDFTGISLLVVGTSVVGHFPTGRQNRPRNGGIHVANHTSPIDVIILASDGYYTM
ncbi:Glycerol-3-phosphate acyltransferase 4, partial [Saguinus oedipus]